MSWVTCSTWERMRLQMDLACGESAPDGGWIATSYGRSQAAPRVRFHGHLDLPVSLAFVLTAARQASDSVEATHLCVTTLHGDPIDDAIGLQLSVPDVSHFVGFCWDSTGRKRMHDFEFDKRLFVAQKNHASTPIAYSSDLAATSVNRQGH